MSSWKGGGGYFTGLGLLREGRIKSPDRCGSFLGWPFTLRLLLQGWAASQPAAGPTTLAEPRERQPSGPDLGEGNVSEKGQVLERAQCLGRRGVRRWPSRAELGDHVRPEGLAAVGPQPRPGQEPFLGQALPAPAILLGCVHAAGHRTLRLQGQ